MNLQQKHSVVYRLLSGILHCKVSSQTYLVCPPTVEILYEADELYNELLYIESFNEDFPPQYLLQSLIGIPDIDDRIKKMCDRQDDLKVEMFESYLNAALVAKLRKNLNLVKSKLNELYDQKHGYDYLTPVGFAAMVKSQFILSRTVLDKQKQPVFTCDFDNVDYLLLDNIMAEVTKNQLSHDQLREVARSEPWRSYWGVNKDNVFGKPPLELTEDQRYLASYSKMYDNIFENSDCPNDDIIEDNDLLDGWMIKMRRERDSDKKGKEINHVLGDRHKNDNEVFLVTSKTRGSEGTYWNPKGTAMVAEPEQVDSLNTPLARQQKQQREKIIQEKGEVLDKEFPDVQIDILNKGKG